MTTGKTFKDESIHLDGQAYETCTFENCTLIFSGGEIPTVAGCEFRDCQWRLEGAADRTVSFLKSLYHVLGEGGRTLIEAKFEVIRKA
ncbi:MAG: hypothetical protein HY290_07585 [Planctomycetia bacterium]|nr:hypothetical protein [Planctomycetia bacterium]